MSIINTQAVAKAQKEINGKKRATYKAKGEQPGPIEGYPGQGKEKKNKI